MSEASNELESLRREVAELKAGLEALRSQDPSYQHMLHNFMHRKLKEGAAQKGKSAGVGVMWDVVLYQRAENNVFSANTRFWFDGAALPSEQRLMETAAAFASRPLVVRALYRFVQHFLDGGAMTLPKSELAAAMGISDAELEDTLRPLVADETLRWGKTAEGEEYYEWLQPNAFLVLLALA
jgi:hypothetical protein